MTPEIPRTDRRSNHRYHLQTPVRYRAANAPLNGPWKPASALNMSACGILLQLSEPVAKGTKLELAIDWSGLYHGRDRMRLFLLATVTRIDSGRAALQIARHRFREIPATRVRVPRADKNRAVA